MANDMKRILIINDTVEIDFKDDAAKDEYYQIKAEYQCDSYHSAIMQCADEISKVSQYNAKECGHPIKHAINLAVHAVSQKKYSSFMFLKAIEILKDKWKYGHYLDSYDNLMAQTGKEIKDCL